MKYLFKTEAGRVLMFPGTGTGGWESCLTNTLSPGDKVVCFRYGVFSNLWIDMAQRLGLNVIVLDEEWGNGADEERLRQVLADDVNKEIKAVMVVQNETATGITSELHKCRQAIDAAQHPALFTEDELLQLEACVDRLPGQAYAPRTVDAAPLRTRDGL